MNKAFKKFRRNKKADCYERAAELIMFYKGYTINDLMEPNLLQKDHDLFYGFWGQVLNRSQRIKGTSSSVSIIKKWKDILFQLDDPRYKEETKDKKSIETEGETEKKKKELEKKPVRMFIVTSNIDGEFIKAGMKENELYETRGDILNWQCVIPCCKQFFKVNEDFRFEISLEGGIAKPVKFTERKQTQKETKETSTVDEKEFNFFSPTGKKDYFKKQLYATSPRFSSYSKYPSTPRSGRISETEAKPHPSSFGEGRGLYYRYFSPDVSEQIKNPEFYFRPSSGSRLTTVFNKDSCVLGALRQLEKEASLTPYERKDAVIQRHEVFPMEEETQTNNKESEENIHRDLHELAFSNYIEPIDEGVLEITIIDPMIHYHQFYTDINKTDEIITEKDIEEFKSNPLPIVPRDNTLIPGSNIEFLVSVQIFDLDKGGVCVSYFKKTIPTIRRKREEDGICVDSLVLNVHELTEVPDHTLPLRGKVSLVCQQLESKNSKVDKWMSKLYKKRIEDKPWQLVGEFNMKKFVEKNKESYFQRLQIKQLNRIRLLQTEEEISTSYVNVRMLDFNLRSKDTIHQLKMRAIQQSEKPAELLTIFVDTPISDFSTVNDKTLDVSTPLESNTGVKVSESINTSITKIMKELPIPSVPKFPKAINQNETTIEMSPISPTFNENSFKRSSTPAPFLPKHNVSLGNLSKAVVETDLDLFNPKKKPLMNRIFCESCRGLARPRVKMNPNDDAWVKTSMLNLRSWTTKVKKAMQEEGRSVVIIEIGAEQKLRQISEGFMKQTQHFGCEMIRINPKLKKSIKTGQKEVLKPPGAEEQYNLIDEESTFSVINKIEQHLTEIAEKTSLSY
ncbi:hypothetical protein ABK040_008219 [Willaertia magna]